MMQKEEVEDTPNVVTATSSIKTKPIDILFDLVLHITSFFLN